VSAIPDTRAELYRVYGPLVLRRARALLGDEHAAHDATHDVFVRVLASLAEFRAESSPVTWLYRVTTNHCLNVLRGRLRRPEVGTSPGVDPSVEDAVSVDERLTLDAVLARVPEHLREVAVYYYLDQMSHEEIAQVMGVSRRTVGNRLCEFHSAARLAAGEVTKVVS
jgi:RNA polymerase sigma-70 factor (ECF subfamily)